MYFVDSQLKRVTDRQTDNNSGTSNVTLDKNRTPKYKTNITQTTYTMNRITSHG